MNIIFVIIFVNSEILNHALVCEFILLIMIVWRQHIGIIYLWSLRRRHFSWITFRRAGMV